MKIPVRFYINPDFYTFDSSNKRGEIEHIEGFNNKIQTKLKLKGFQSLKRYYFILLIT